MDKWFAVYFDFKWIFCPQVAKSVSLRLHSELEAIQKKNSRLEWENEELRERLQDLEVAKQVLQAEMDKSQVVWPQSHRYIYIYSTYTQSIVQKFNDCI